MSVERYGIIGNSSIQLVPDPNGHLVKHQDHEAAVRIQAARSEQIGVETCLNSLAWECQKYGMSHEEINQHETFEKLLAAFAKYVADDEMMARFRSGNQ